MKTVAEMAEKWECNKSTVYEYCRSGIIPAAYKEGAITKHWLIPDECEKPPMTRHGLCVLMNFIYLLNNGVLYSAIKWGYKMEEVKAGYEYLVSNGFITTIDVSNLSVELINSSVTKDGEALINAENKKIGSIKYKAQVNLAVDLGPLTASVDGEISNH